MGYPALISFRKNGCPDTEIPVGYFEGKHKLFCQITAVVGDGALAAFAVERYIEDYEE